MWAGVSPTPRAERCSSSGFRAAPSCVEDAAVEAEERRVGNADHDERNQVQNRRDGHDLSESSCVPSCVCVCVCVCVYVCVCVWACVCERERESACVYLCV